MSYALNIAIALDQLANALLAGDPDETLSSRAWRAEQKGQRYWGWTRRAIDLLFSGRRGIADVHTTTSARTAPEY